MTEPVRPVAGPTFRHVAALPIEGAKRRKVAGLVAAYRDAGVSPVGVGLLAERLDWPVLTIKALAARLEADGLLVTSRKGRRLRINPDALPAEPQPREAIA
jgi:hypothetical protein